MTTTVSTFKSVFILHIYRLVFESVLVYVYTGWHDIVPKCDVAANEYGAAAVLVGPQ